MNKLYAAAFAVVLLGTGAFATDKLVAKADILQTSDSKTPMGDAKFYDEGSGKIKLDLTLNYPEKANSIIPIHFHEFGKCGNKGNDAGGHWNPTGSKHGSWDAKEHHSGDLGNIKLDSKGIGKVSITTNLWSVDKKDKNNIIGIGIIAHGGVDDYKTQPTGNSGDRIGCGVVEAQ